LREEKPSDFVAKRPVLDAAAFTIASEEDLIWLRQYAEAGGHLVTGIRTGYEDQEARARVERKPAFLHSAAGVWYEEFSNLREPLPITTGGGAGDLGFAPAREATGMLWADGLQVKIGRASCRERVGVAGGAVGGKRKAGRRTQQDGSRGEGEE